MASISSPPTPCYPRCVSPTPHGSVIPALGVLRPQHPASRYTEATPCTGSSCGETQKLKSPRLRHGNHREELPKNFHGWSQGQRTGTSDTSDAGPFKAHISVLHVPAEGRGGEEHRRAAENQDEQAQYRRTRSFTFVAQNALAVWRSLDFFLE